MRADHNSRNQRHETSCASALAPRKRGQYNGHNSQPTSRLGRPNLKVVSHKEVVGVLHVVDVVEFALAKVVMDKQVVSSVFKRVPS